jgi:uncharacterized protein
MIIERDIIEELIAWKERDNRKPLILRGARQVGKTFTVERFARQHFENYIHINLEEQKDIRALFDHKNVQNIIDELSILFNEKIVPGKTLLFIDEIQVAPEAIVCMRYFYEQAKELHVIAAGSLLDHTLNEIRSSMPVGRIDFCTIHPISFKEFLKAADEILLLEYLEKYRPGDTFSELIHKKALGFLRLYFFIGGMPEAVSTYLKNKGLINAGRIHSSIVSTLRYDFGKYGNPKEQETLRDVMDYSANNIGRKVKYVNVNNEIRSDEIKSAFKKLSLSRIIHLIEQTAAGGVPLSAHRKENNYKPLFLDIGLANHIGNIQLIKIENLVTINEGALAEQFIGQELLNLVPPYIDPKLYYWSREQKNSNAEVDYLFQFNNQIFPIEVKSGKGGALKSLHVFLFEKELNTGIRFNADTPNFGQLQVKLNVGGKLQELSYQLISLPLYLCFRLPEILEQYLLMLNNSNN